MRVLELPLLAKPFWSFYKEGDRHILSEGEEQLPSSSSQCLQHSAMPFLLVRHLSFQTEPTWWPAEIPLAFNGLLSESRFCSGVSKWFCWSEAPQSLLQLGFATFQFYLCKTRQPAFQKLIFLLSIPREGCHSWEYPAVPPRPSVHLWERPHQLAWKFITLCSSWKYSSLRVLCGCPRGYPSKPEFFNGQQPVI